MTSREAKRIAIGNIINDVLSSLACSEGRWRMHPDTAGELSDEDAERVKDAAKAIVAALERRGSRLRSFSPARARS